MYVYFSSLSTHNKAVMKEILEEVMEDPDNDYLLETVKCLFVFWLYFM